MYLSLFIANVFAIRISVRMCSICIVLCVYSLHVCFFMCCVNALLYKLHVQCCARGNKVIAFAFAFVMRYHVGVIQKIFLAKV